MAKKSPLNRRLFMQGGMCFYCRQPLELSNATQDHVIAKALGGKDDTDNLVVCCRTINQYFADCTPKDKLDLIIKMQGQLKCPASKDPSATAHPDHQTTPKTAL